MARRPSRRGAGHHPGDHRRPRAVQPLRARFAGGDADRRRALRAPRSTALAHPGVGAHHHRGSRRASGGGARGGGARERRGAAAARRGRADRRRRHGLPVPAGARSRCLLALARGRRGRHHRGASRPVGRRRALRSGRIGRGEGQHPVGWVPRSRRPLRSAVLRHLAARGDPDGSATAPRARAGLGGARGRRHSAPAPRGEPHRCLPRCPLHGLRAPPGSRGARGDHRAHEHRRRGLHHRQPRLVRARVAGAEPDGGHRVLVVAGGRAPRLSEPALGGERPGPRRRGQPDARARDDDGLQPPRGHVARRALARVQRGRQRLRAVGGGRRGGAQAPLRRAPRRGPDLRARARQRGEQRRRQQRPHGAEPEGPAGRPPRRLPERGARAPRRPLRGGARHGHAARRSHRGLRARGDLRGGAPGGRAPAHRLGQDQRGAPRGRRGDRGDHQGRPGDEARSPPAQLALRPAQSAHRFRGAAPPGGEPPPALAGAGGRPAARGGELVRLRRHQRSRHPRERAALGAGARADRRGGRRAGRRAPSRGVGVLGPGLAVGGHGARARARRARVPRRARSLRSRPPPPPRLVGLRRDPPRRAPVRARARRRDVAGDVRLPGGAGRAPALARRRAGGGDRAQHRRGRRGPRGGRALDRGRGARDRRAGAARPAHGGHGEHAPRGHRLGRGGGARGGVRGARHVRHLCQPDGDRLLGRRSGARRSGSVPRGSRGLRPGGQHERRGAWAADGVPRGGSAWSARGDRPQASGDPHRLHGDRRGAARAGLRRRLLGPAAPRARALRAGHRAAARRGVRALRRGLAAPDRGAVHRGEHRLLGPRGERDGGDRAHPGRGRGPLAARGAGRDLGALRARRAAAGGPGEPGSGARAARLRSRSRRP